MWPTLFERNLPTRGFVFERPDLHCFRRQHCSQGSIVIDDAPSRMFDLPRHSTFLYPVRKIPKLVRNLDAASTKIMNQQNMLAGEFRKDRTTAYLGFVPGKGQEKAIGKIERLPSRARVWFNVPFLIRSRSVCGEAHRKRNLQGSRKPRPISSHPDPPFKSKPTTASPVSGSEAYSDQVSEVFFCVGVLQPITPRGFRLFFFGRFRSLPLRGPGRRSGGYWFGRLR